jgi:hypothetical protein
MNVERIYERLPKFIVLVGGLLFAAFCGVLAGGGQFNRLSLLLGGILVMALSLVLKARIWVIIPLFWPLGGSIPITDLPFAVRDMAVGITFVCFLFLMGFKVLRGKLKLDLVDLFVVVNVFYMLTVFIRNPVGAKAFNSEMVGGKPYFNVFIACIAYYLFCRVPVDLKMVSRLPLFLLPAPALVALGSLITTYVPALGAKIGLGLIYSDFAPREMALNVDDRLGRKVGLAGFGATGMQVLTAYYRPLTLLFPANFGRVVLAIIFFVAVLLSGFRSLLIVVVAYVVLSTWFRRKAKDLLAFLVLGIFGLIFLSLGNGTLFELPLAAQRTLSFLPGKWDQTAVIDAQASIDWRVDMWATVLKEDRWIRNKYFGDGFGFTRIELAIMEAAAEGESGFIGGMQQEAFMINGVFHHGPLSTIRFVGVVGLVLFYSLILLLVFRVVKIVRVSYGTSLFPACLFVGMPVFYYALAFPFGGGQFDVDVPHYIFTAGLVKLVGAAVESLPPMAESSPESSLVDPFVGRSAESPPVERAGLPLS